MSSPAPLDASRLAALAARLTAWTVTPDQLGRTWTFATFRDAMAFMQDAAVEIDRLDHHPEWTNVYNRVECRLRTHDAGNRVTAKDAELAALLEWVATRFTDG